MWCIALVHWVAAHQKAVDPLDGVMSLAEQASQHGRIGYIKAKTAQLGHFFPKKKQSHACVICDMRMRWETNTKYSIPGVLRVETVLQNNLIYPVTAMGVVHGDLLIAARDLVYVVSEEGCVRIRPRLNENQSIRFIKCILPSSTDFECALAGLSSSVGGDGISHKTHLVIYSGSPHDINEFTLPDNALSQLTLDRGVPKYTPLPPRPLYIHELGPLIRGGAWFCAQLTDTGVTAGTDGIRSYIWDAATRCVYEITAEGVGYVAGPFAEISRYETVSVAERGGVVFLAAGKTMYRITRSGKMQTFDRQTEQPVFVARVTVCPRRAHLINHHNGREVILQDGSVYVCAATLGAFNAYFGALMNGQFIESSKAPRLAMTVSVFRCIVEYIHMGSVAIDTENQLSTLAGLVEAAWYTGETTLSRAALYYILANVGYTNEKHVMFVDDEHVKARDWYRAFAIVSGIMVEELHLDTFRHIMAILVCVNLKVCMEEFPPEITLEHTMYLLNTVNRRITDV